jgi:hypothetical protein
MEDVRMGPYDYRADYYEGGGDVPLWTSLLTAALWIGSVAVLQYLVTRPKFKKWAKRRNVDLFCGFASLFILPWPCILFVAWLSLQFK